MCRAGLAETEAGLDARVMAQWLLGWDAARFLTSADQEPRPAFQAAYDALVERRARREPMAYLFGGQEFYGRMFEVTPAVLIPRPESEIIVEAALAVMAPDTAYRVADVGTGSGCLAVTIACERAAARVVATDVSAEALEIALFNVMRHGVERHVFLVQGDLLPDRSGDDRAGGFDVIVANPPYVPERDRATLPPEVRDFEPATALFGGADGLDVIRRLIPAAAERLAAGGHLIFEIGAGQHEAVAGLISATPHLRMVGLRNDLQGIPRTVVVRQA